MALCEINLYPHWPIPWNQPLPYIEGLLFMDFHNVTLTSQKPCQHNNKFHCSETNGYSDFIWSFLLPYMGVNPNPKMAFIFPISRILVLIFPNLYDIFSQM